VPSTRPLLALCCLFTLCAGLAAIDLHAVQYPRELEIAETLLKKGRPDNALRALDDLGEPGEAFSGLALWYRAVAKAQLGEWDEAVHLWVQAVEQAPNLRRRGFEGYPSGEELAARLPEDEPAPAAISEPVVLERGPLEVPVRPTMQVLPVTPERPQRQGPAVDLATVEVAPALRSVHGALAAGRYREALTKSRATSKPQWRADLDFVPHALALEAFARRENGESREALCTWLQAIHLDPELEGARFGSLEPFQRPGAEDGMRPPGSVPPTVTYPALLERRLPRRYVDLDGIPSGELVGSMRVLVDPAGAVAWVRVDSRARPAVLLALVDSACRWRYRPGTRDGEPSLTWIGGNISLAPPAD
jgi:tetratricopeptide (TPR) repeat protein